MVRIAPTDTLIIKPDTSAAELKAFLGNAKAGDKVFGTKYGETTTLYLAQRARDSGDLKHDDFHKMNFNLRHKTAREEIGTILKNTATTKFNALVSDRSDVNNYKTAVETLMNNVIDHSVREEKTLHSNYKPLTVAQANENVTKALEALDATTKQTELLKTNLPKLSPAPELPTTTSRILEGETKTLLVTIIESDEYANHDKQFPALEIDGKKFVAQEFMGVGGYGFAIKYGEDGGTATKIVKFAYNFDGLPVEKTDGKYTDEALNRHRQEATIELAAGDKYAKGTQNVIGYTSHVELPNGTLALISDPGSKGDVFKFAQLLDTSGVSPHARRLITLTMTKDIATGVKSLHEKGGIHADMKPPNQVIDAEGRTHLIDLGLTRRGPKISVVLGTAALARAPQYGAPEALALDVTVNEDLIQAKRKAEERFKTIEAELEDIFELASDEMNVSQLQKFGQTLYQGALAEAADEYAVDEKVDVFGIGQSAYMLATGKMPSTNRNERAALDSKAVTTDLDEADIATTKKIELGKDPAAHGLNVNTEGTPYENNALVDGVGDVVLSWMLDDLLMPNPTNRPDDDGVINHPTMAYASNEKGDAVGSKEVRALILAIASEDIAKVKEAELALTNAYPEPKNLEHFEKELQSRRDQEQKPRVPLDKLIGRPAPVPMSNPALGSPHSFGEADFGYRDRSPVWRPRSPDMDQYSYGASPDMSPGTVEQPATPPGHVFLDTDTE